MSPQGLPPDRALLLIPAGADADTALSLLAAAPCEAAPCADAEALQAGLLVGADLAILADEALTDVDVARLGTWVEAQPTWSDFPFIILTRKNGGPDRDPFCARLGSSLGNVAFLERPFHPTTLLSAIRTAQRARRRQLQARATIEALSETAELLRVAQQAGRVGSFEVFPDRDEMRVSEQFRRQWGLPDRTAFGLDELLAIVVEEDRAQLRAGRDDRFDPTLDYVEFRIRRADTGELRWMARRAESVPDSRSQTTRLLGVSYDITARKTAEVRQTFLLDLSDALRSLSDPREIVAAAINGLGRHLLANRVGYAQVQPDGETSLLLSEYTTDVEPLDGLFRLDEFGRGNIARLRRGVTSVYEDAAADPENAGAALAEFQIRGLIAVPLLGKGELRAALYVNQSEPRAWTPDEVALVEDVAARTWDAIERVRAQDMLQESVADLRMVADSLPVMIGLVDRALVYRFANLAYVQWFGLSPDEVVGRTVRDLVGEEGYRLRQPQIDRALAGEAVAFESDWPHLDGRPRTADVRYLPRRDAGGAVEGFYIFVQDITDRILVERLLRQTNETLEASVTERTRDRDRLWTLSQEIMMVSDYAGTVLSINPSTTRVLGWTDAEMVGHRLSEFVHPDELALTLEHLQRLSEGEAAEHFESRYRTKSGGYCRLSWNAIPFGGLIHAVARDVTLERQRQDELDAAQDQLRQAHKMEAVGQLTGGIAHDFNNLLTGITGSLDLLQQRITQGRMGDVDRFINGAMSSAQRAAALTHRLLAFSRRQPLDPKPVKANPLVASMDDLLRRTLGERIALEVVLERGLWLTLCDANQLESAILNLCINARDAMPEGGRLRIETYNAQIDPIVVEMGDEIAGGDYVCVSVGDTGGGMSPDTVARAFDPFFTTKPIGQGTGLGLSMIYGFTRQSGGYTRISSEVGQGTTVRLFLPRHDGDGEADGSPVAIEARLANLGDTVLVVEDEAVVRALIVEMLGDLGYRVLEAGDGEAGLEAISASQTIDLLLTDLGLPGMNGRDLAAEARRLRPDLPVLFMTGYAETAAAAAGFLEPGMELITKPFMLEALGVRVHDMLKRVVTAA